jgi:hypothetical protein
MLLTANVSGGQDPDALGLTEQLVASLHERLFHLGDLFEESFGYGFIARGPQFLREDKLRGAQGQELRVHFACPCADLTGDQNRPLYRRHVTSGIRVSDGRRPKTI